MSSDRDESRLRNKIVVLLGGTGFLGRHLVQELLERGARVRIVGRRPERAYSLKPLGIIGQIQFVPIEVTRGEHLARVLAGADAVVNLLGAFAGDLDRLQGKGAGEYADAAREAGVQAFVHVSAIGADADSPIAYARTKAEGERAVLAAFPKATIVRPAILFGPDDSFVNRFGGLLAALPVLPVFGPTAPLQPLLVDDAADAIAAALEDPATHGGKTYEIAGPEVLTMLELNQRIAAAQARKRLLVELPDAVSSAFARLTGWLPGAPITLDQWRLLQQGNVASGKLPGLKALGVTPRPLGLFLDRWMVRFRKHGRFGNKAPTR